MIFLDLLSDIKIFILLPRLTECSQFVKKRDNGEGTWGLVFHIRNHPVTKRWNEYCNLFKLDANSKILNFFNKVKKYRMRVKCNNKKKNGGYEECLPRWNPQRFEAIFQSSKHFKHSHCSRMMTNSRVHITPLVAEGPELLHYNIWTRSNYPCIGGERKTWAHWF